MNYIKLSLFGHNTFIFVTFFNIHFAYFFLTITTTTIVLIISTKSIYIYIVSDRGKGFWGEEKWICASQTLQTILLRLRHSWVSNVSMSLVFCSDWDWSKNLKILWCLFYSYINWHMLKLSNTFKHFFWLGQQKKCNNNLL